MSNTDNLAKIAALCKSENMTYRTDLYENYSFSSQQKNGTFKRVDLRKYNFPLLDASLQAIAERNKVSKIEVSQASFDIASGVVRDYKISKYLQAKGVQSTVQYHSYKSVSDGGAVVYAMIDGMIPLSEIWKHRNITMGFVIDIARRLYAICVDLEKVGVTHRNITPYNIFFTADTNRLVLGGFDCAMLPDEEKPKINPFTYTCHMAPAIKAGERGDLTTDVYSIASIMGCFFEGSDITGEYHHALSGVVPPHIKEAIELGLSLDRESLPLFRKKLNMLYHESKGLYWNTPITTMYQMQLHDGNDPAITEVIRASTPKVENQGRKKVIGRNKAEKQKRESASKRKNGRKIKPDQQAKVQNSTEIVKEKPEKKKMTKKDGFGMIASLLAGMLVMCLLLLFVGYFCGFVVLE